MKRTIITKVFVVVDSETINRPVSIEGGDLIMMDTDQRKGNSKLIVMDATKTEGVQHATLAVFRKWAYWRIKETKETNEPRKEAGKLTRE